MFLTEVCARFLKETRLEFPSFMTTRFWFPLVCALILMVMEYIAFKAYWDEIFKISKWQLRYLSPNNTSCETF